MAKEQDIQRPVQQIDPIKEEKSSRRIRGTTSAIPTDTGRSWERIDFPETSSPKEIDEVDFPETSSPKEIDEMEDLSLRGTTKMAKEQDIQFPAQQIDPIEDEGFSMKIEDDDDPPPGPDSTPWPSSLVLCGPATFDPKIVKERESQSCESTYSVGSDIESGERETDKYMDLELYRAATRNDFISVLKPESTEIDNSYSPFGNSVLHVAASSGNEKNVRDIVDKFPSLLTKQNSKGDTALHIAAKAGHPLVVEALVGLQRDSLLRLENNEGNTALHEALINCPKSVAIDHLIQADPEVIYYRNNEEKSPLYLAAEAGYVDCLKKMLENQAVNGNIYERIRGKSPVHAALMWKNEGVLDMIFEKDPELIHLRHRGGRTLLHCAASMGSLKRVRYLLKHKLSAFERDKYGNFPVHLASFEGHVDVIKELLRYFPYPWELLNNNHQNILHVAAKSGKHDVVSYILKTRGFEKMINEKDKDGNTPLHLATMNWHPNIVSALTWDKRVKKKLRVINNEGLTALDAALYYMDYTPSFQQRLTWAALKSAGAPRGPSRKGSNEINKNPEVNMDNYVNTLLLVSTLIATVTFAAGFTMPGGYNDSDLDQGMASMLKRRLFHMFVFCDTIAMYSSIVVVLTLIWGQLRDLKLLHTAHRMASPFLAIALTSMSLAFMAGVCLVVSKLSWLFTTILIMSLVFVVAFLLLLFLLWSPVESPRCILRYITYYPFRLLIYMAQCE